MSILEAPTSHLCDEASGEASPINREIYTRQLLKLSALLDVLLWSKIISSQSDNLQQDFFNHEYNNQHVSLGKRSTAVCTELSVRVALWNQRAPPLRGNQEKNVKRAYFPNCMYTSHLWHPESTKIRNPRWWTSRFQYNCQEIHYCWQ